MHPLVRLFDTNRQVCFNVLQLQAALDRSGGAQLDVEVAEFNMEMAQLVANERERWSSFQFVHGDYEDLPTRWLLAQTENLPLLNAVTLYSVTDREDIRKWLEVVQPKFIHLDFAHGLEILNNASWAWATRLCSLDVSMSRIVSPTTLIPIPVATQLTDLTLQGIKLHNKGPIKFPNLLRAEISEVDHWWNIEAPKLRVLVLSSLREDSSLIKVTYPLLEELSYVGKRLMVLPSLDLETPALESLAITYILLHPENFLSILPGWFCAPTRLRNLEIWLCTFATPDLIYALEAQDSLQSLQFMLSELSQSLIEAFIPTSTSSILCPNLKRMVLGIEPTPKYTQKLVPDEVKVALKDIVQRRRARNVPLERLNVIWPEDWEKDEPESDWCSEFV